MGIRAGRANGILIDGILYNSDKAGKMSSLIDICMLLHFNCGARQSKKTFPYCPAMRMDGFETRSKTSFDWRVS
jgi:hypothetical protein